MLILITTDDKGREFLLPLRSISLTLAGKKKNPNPEILAWFTEITFITE